MSSSPSSEGTPTTAQSTIAEDPVLNGHHQGQEAHRPEEGDRDGGQGESGGPAVVEARGVAGLTLLAGRAVMPRRASVGMVSKQASPSNVWYRNGAEEFGFDPVCTDFA